MSWGAVLAGTAIAVAMSLLLGVVGLALGIGGLQVIHNVAQGADTITAGAGAGLWMVFSTLVSMALGGYVAGRLAGTFSHLDAELHGLTVWALTAMATAILLGQLVSAAISDVSRGIGPMAAAAIGTGSGNETGATAPRGQGLIDRLQSSLSTGGDPAHMTRDQITAEISLLIDRRLTNGSFAPTERDRLITLLMQRDGIGHDEAALRITRLEQEASGIITRTRLAGANAVQLGARAVSASLLLGLMASLLGAWFGTRHVRRIAAEAPAVSHVVRTIYEPPVHQTPVVHDVVPPRPAVFDITGLTLPATKADLLRQARTAGVEPALLAALERAADRRYMNIEDLLSELRVTAS
jgi:hypothetical protein